MSVLLIQPLVAVQKQTGQQRTGQQQTGLMAFMTGLMVGRCLNGSWLLCIPDSMPPPLFSLFYPLNSFQRRLSINEGTKRALVIVTSWYVNKKETRKKGQERLKSDLGFGFFSSSARKDNKCPPPPIESVKVRHSIAKIYTNVSTTTNHWSANIILTPFYAKNFGTAQ